MMQNSPLFFKENVRYACSNEKIKTAVKKATSLTLEKMSAIVNEYRLDGIDWEKLREQAHTIRKKTIDNLDYYLKELQRRFNKNGIEVIHAKTGTIAASVVSNILTKHGVRLVVKSKSMVTEEINLNSDLFSKGIEVVETDLGEYIIQLAGETPSHITAPAIHKSCIDIGKLFSEKLGVPYTDNPSELTSYARKFLREKFLKANAGISGANFLVVESGSIVIVENEGNARLSTSIPDLHIVVTGIEKVVPTLDELVTILKLLPVSATGQKATSYVSFINSPAKLTHEKRPQKIVVILVDNGRRELLQNIEARSALYCIKCGACMNICPVYEVVSGHAYGSIYPGPIGSILTPFLSTLEEGKDLAYGSSLCGACSEICPVKIELHSKLLWIRHLTVKNNNASFAERILFMFWRVVVGNIKIYNLVTSIIRFLQPLFTAENKFIKIPILSEKKYFPLLAEKSFHQMWKEKK